MKIYGHPSICRDVNDEQASPMQVRVRQTEEPSLFHDVNEVKFLAKQDFSEHQQHPSTSQSVQHQGNSRMLATMPADLVEITPSVLCQKSRSSWLR